MPDVSMVHVDQALTNVSISYRNAQYVCDELFPPAPVGKQSNKYFVYGTEKFKQRDDTRRPGAVANEIDWSLSTDTYYAEGHALSQLIPDELRSNADPVLDMDIDTTEALTEAIYIQRELLAASKATDTSVVTNHKSSAAWDNAQSTPITDVEAAKKSVLLHTMKRANIMIISYPVFIALRNHPSILARGEFAQTMFPGDVTAQFLANKLGVDRVVVADAVYDTAPEGEAMSPDFVWGKNAIIAHQEPPGRRTINFGNQFRWLFGANTQGYLVKRWRVESRTGDMVEVQLFHDLKVVAAQSAYLFDGAIS